MTSAAGNPSGEDSRLPSPARIPEPVGDPTVPARAPGLSGSSSGLSRLRRSVWAPAALKSAGILAGMLALAGIGAASSLAGAGVPVAIAASAPHPEGSAPHTEIHPIAAPAGGSPAAPSGPTTGGVAGSSSPGITSDGKVILNTATAEDLQKLPRVGAKRAAAILELRTRLGRFRQPTDLLRVRGIGRKTLRSLTPLLVVDAPK